MKKVIALILLVSLPASAGIYKWTDSEGNVHFGDKPVDQESATELDINTDSRSGITNSSGNKKEREYLLKKIDEEKQETADKNKERRELKKKYKILCSNYKVKLHNQIRANSLYELGPDGERKYLSDKERATRRAKIEKGIAKYCR